MPHECTACGRTFPDGSKEMLSGCPDCGGTKFQFRPRTSGTGADPEREESLSDFPSADDAEVTGREWPIHGDEPTDERRARGRVGSRARGAPASDSGVSGEAEAPADPGRSSYSDLDSDSDDGIVVADEEPVGDDGESSAQADARSGFAAPEEVARGAAADDSKRETMLDETGATAADEESVTADSTDTPDLSALRKELNEQFESIRIVSPGRYELNLMELYEREEHIISLREDGRYVIEVPETWRTG
jgi:predicted  nucleic acid-binding Zn-ribbon protein